jgi:hypothetical protein
MGGSKKPCPPGHSHLGQRPHPSPQQPPGHPKARPGEVPGPAVPGRQAGPPAPSHRQAPRTAHGGVPSAPTLQRKTPVAPPVYRPQPLPKVLQAKTASSQHRPGARLANGSAARPHSEPQSAPRDPHGRSSSTGRQPPNTQPLRNQVGPLTPRPQVVTKVLQAKTPVCISHVGHGRDARKEDAAARPRPPVSVQPKAETDMRKRASHIACGPETPAGRHAGAGVARSKNLPAGPAARSARLIQPMLKAAPATPHTFRPPAAIGRGVGGHQPPASHERAGLHAGRVVQLRRVFQRDATPSYDRFLDLLGREGVQNEEPGPWYYESSKALAEIIYTNKRGETKTQKPTTPRSSGKTSRQYRDCTDLNPAFMARPEEDKGGVNAFCAEVQVIHDIYPRLVELKSNEARDVLVRIFTTWTPCAACDHDIRALHSLFPTTEIVVRSGSQYTQTNQNCPPGVPYKSREKADLLKMPRLAPQVPLPQPVVNQLPPQVNQVAPQINMYGRYGITRGHYKGYKGEVRSIYGNKVTVLLEATGQKITVNDDELTPSTQ